MNRDQMLQKLKELPYRAYPTVATMDMGLQYRIVCSEGTGEDLGDMATWPAYRFAGIPEPEWSRIRDRAMRRVLTVDDLKETSLAGFGTDLHHYYCRFEGDEDEEYEDYEEEDEATEEDEENEEVVSQAEEKETRLGTLLCGLGDLPARCPDFIFCLYDVNPFIGPEAGVYPEFFATEDECHRAFQKRYGWIVDSWEDFDDEELEYWLEKAGDGSIPSEFPYNTDIF